MQNYIEDLTYAEVLMKNINCGKYYLWKILIENRVFIYLNMTFGKNNLGSKCFREI